MGMCAEPMPYHFELGKTIPGTGEFTRTYKDDHEFNTGNAEVSTFSIKESDLCNGNRATLLRIGLFMELDGASHCFNSFVFTVE